MQIQIEDIRSETPEHRVLFGKAQFLGILLHFTALQVEKDDQGYWHATEEEWEKELEHLLDLAEPDGELMATEIPGYNGQYLVYLYPFTL